MKSIHSASRHGHEKQRALREDAMQLGTESPPNAHAIHSIDAQCAQIKAIEKLIKIKELQIKYLQDLIEIETFDKDSTHAALIKEKANTELEYATKLGELKVLFPCPVKSCTHSKANGINSFRNKHKRPTESPILPATLILDKNAKKSNKNSKIDKPIKNPVRKTRQESKNAVDDIIPTKNSFASLVIQDAAEATDKNSESPMIEDNSEENQINEDVTVTPKIKPIMLRYKDNFNLILQDLNKKYPNSVNKLTGHRWQHLSNYPNRRRIAILSPFRIKKEETSSPHGFISAEFRKFFRDFPRIIDAGKAFKNAKTNEDCLDIFFGVLASEGKTSSSP
ncbi:hypothetical protein TNIN_89181 [Trichonephila inaurata madagascariensis]|uniref:Uncharacterized protein n=1 Tax=Trichonephila inaurata madagascariensis TaxID=2747483 RepID=A0A8X6WY47_9ARAC|nr:hypothetical protein TNIN_89181 [Trichonephila inaurata madagascariensis]